MKINDKGLKNPIIITIIYAYLLPLILIILISMPIVMLYIIPALILGFIDIKLQAKEGGEC